ncbi:unnamed protein product [Microthlaspi erraticum]|uniref:Reverse transcriptase Ty1/copia-type domain-containing protein n=1 Tax=Microthlaspi erraticum TaxID=1685480 RepID=A0A6D2KUR0_9BRAS|nr:unnamed protein product [Microthlaspi erraticum]
MVNRSLDVNKDPFRLIEDSDEMLGPEVPYMSAIGALMYLANCTRPDIAFATNLLARYSSSPTRRHWNGIKHIFRYLQGSIANRLCFHIRWNRDLWRSQKQTLVATSSNYAEIRECVWLRSLIQHIQEASGVSTKKEPTIIYEDNSACVTQLKEGYIKSDRTKHIPPRFFSYTQELEKNQEVDIQYVRQVTMQLISSQRRFLQQCSRSTFKVLECIVCKICEEKTISISGEFASRNPSKHFSTDFRRHSLDGFSTDVSTKTVVILSINLLQGFDGNVLRQISREIFDEFLTTLSTKTGVDNLLGTAGKLFRH